MIKNTFYLLLVGALAFSCKKEEPTPSTPITTPTTPATEQHFISAKIDGVTWKAVNSENGCQMGYGYSGGMSEPYNVDYFSGFIQDEMVSPITGPLNGNLSIEMANYTYDYTEFMASDTHFTNTFAPGAKNFYQNGGTAPGVDIVYYDQVDMLWSTKFGSQAGSTFTISSMTSGVLGPHKVKFVKGTFTGKLYDESGASFKTVTDGSFYAVFQKPE